MNPYFSGGRSSSTIFLSLAGAPRPRSAGDAAVVRVRREHEIAAGQRVVRRHAGRLGPDAVADDLHEQLHAGMQVLLDLRAALAVLSVGRTRKLTSSRGRNPGRSQPQSTKAGVERRIHVLDDALVDVPFEGLFGERLDLEEIEHPVVDNRDPGFLLQDHVDEHGLRHIRPHSRRSSAGRIASRRRAAPRTEGVAGGSPRARPVPSGRRRRPSREGRRPGCGPWPASRSV
jgi:hypothetical protein